MLAHDQHSTQPFAPALHPEARHDRRPPVDPIGIACPWPPIMAIYCLYAIITFLGAVTGHHLQAVGAVAFLVFLTVQYGRYLFPLPLSGLTAALLFSFLLPTFALLTGLTVWGDSSSGYAIKYAALLLLILVTANLHLPPIFRARVRFWGLGTVLGVLLLGLAVTGGQLVDRMSSIFVNPNNFALAAMSMLFFIDYERDVRWFKTAMHALVIGLILLSGTTGALLGYLAGAVFYLLHTKFARSFAIAMLGAALLCGVAVVALRNSNPDAFTRMGPVGSMLLKAYILQETFTDLSSSEEINFWEISQAYGSAESTSAVWRMMHWRETFRTYRESGVFHMLFGHGIGSSELVIGRLPHNDYLRLLFEIGLFGFLAIGAVWLILYQRVHPASRWVCVAIAVYAFTENNLDNFLVMSLFVLFMTSARASDPSPDMASSAPPIAVPGEPQP